MQPYTQQFQTSFVILQGRTQDEKYDVFHVVGSHVARYVD